MEGNLSEMVPREEKLRTLDYLCAHLDDSGLYQVLRKDDQSALIQENKPVKEKPRIIDLVVANFFPKVRSFTDRIRSDLGSGFAVAPILYKDKETAFVRFVDTHKSWQVEKTLKHYSVAEIHQVLHLRDIEKAVLQLTGENLIYYHPGSERQEEGLYNHRMILVILDYTHIPEKEQWQGFMDDKESVDYKIPDLPLVMASSVQFDFKCNLATLSAAPRSVLGDANRAGREMTTLAQGYFPDFKSDPGAAYSALSGEES